jgi:hypothetical protein
MAKCQGKLNRYSGNFIVLIFDSLFCLIHTKRKEYRHDYIQKPIVILIFQNSSGATIFWYVRMHK